MPLNRRFRSCVLLVRIWRLPAFRLTNFPEPVRVNRFLAPLWVFIFLFFMSVIPLVISVRAAVLLRRHDHDQAPPFHAGGVFDRAYLSQLCNDRIHERSAHLLIRHFTTAVRQEDFGLVTIG